MEIEMKQKTGKREVIALFEIQQTNSLEQAISFLVLTHHYLKRGRDT